MKGTIVNCLKDLTVESFGKDKWDAAAEKAGFKRGSVIMNHLDFDDAQVIGLIGAVCDVCGITKQQAFDAFGDYWVNVYSQKLYGMYFRKHKDAKSFLTSMQEVHDNVTARMKNAKPPRFQFKWLDEKTLVMRYHSHRGLIELLVSLVKGVGKFYKQRLRVSRVNKTDLKIVFA